MTNVSINRRTLLTGTVALGTIGLLAACGGKKNGPDEQSAIEAGGDLSTAISINEKDPATLKQGGELRLGTKFEANFNIANSDGYNSNTLAVQAAVNSAYVNGGYSSDYTGKLEPNKDYVTDYKYETKNGVQTITFTINEKATFNDGTPIDIEAVRTTWKVAGKDAKGYKTTPSTSWMSIKSIEENGSKKSIKITMEKPYYPIQGTFTSFLHPKLADKGFFNDGMVNKPDDKYWAGPFKVESWDAGQKTLVLTRNDKWWGKKPVLDKIVWRHFEEAAAERAAFKNNEIDATTVGTPAAYNELNGVPDTEYRRGTALRINDIELNPAKIPTPVRRAIVAGIDRKQIMEAQYGQMGWREKLPGSMCFLPLQEGYKDNYPEKTGVEVAQKILEDAGYKKEGEFYVKDGKKETYDINYYGSDPALAGYNKLLDDQLRKIGIETKLVNRSPNERQAAYSSKNFTIFMYGFGITPYPYDSMDYFYRSTNNNGEGKELDALLDKMMGTEDQKKQTELANQLEKEHLEKVATYIPMSNGPAFTAVKKKLANYGPSLFATSLYNPDFWIKVGWEN